MKKIQKKAGGRQEEMLIVVIANYRTVAHRKLYSIKKKPPENTEGFWCTDQPLTLNACSCG